MESVVFLFLLVIFALKVFALINKENVKNSFIIASSAEILYLGVALLGSGAFSAVILHLEYQFVFRILAFFMLFEFFRYKNSNKLSDLAGVGFSKWGVVFGFSIFGSLGISLITSKQLILNAITTSGMSELGYLIIAINIIQAIYLISIFEVIVFKKGESLKKVSNILGISIFTIAGILVFLVPQLYLILPSKFSNINAYHLSFGFDYHGIRGIFALVFAFIMAIIFIYSLDYIKKYKAFYYSFLAILTLALIEIPLSNSFESFYLFWEIMTISSYLLIMHSRSDESISAAKLYFVMCIAGAYFLQVAFSHFYSLGIENFSEIKTVSLTIAVLMLVGFGVKAGIVPVHQWLPVAHPAAPSSISAPLSGILTKAGIFGIIVLVYMLGFHSKVFSYLLITIGLITLFYGEIKTLREKDIKKLFAYSTIGQIGEIVTVLGLMSSAALSGALYHIINHAVVKDLLFLSAGILILSAGSRKLEDLKGIGKKLPFLAFPLGIGIFAISAFPPFGNFNSKFLMIYAAMSSNNYIVAFSLIIGGLIGFIAMLRVFKYIFLYNPEKDFVSVSGFKVIAVYILAFVAFLLGIFPDNVINFISNAINLTLSTNIVLPHFALELPFSILIMIIGAVVVFLYGKTSKKAGIVAAVFSFLAFIVVLMNQFTFGTFFADLILFMAILNFLFAAKYMDHSHKPNRFFANFMIMIIGVLGVSLSENIYSMFFYWEIMGGWALYIALVHEEDNLSIREATKYLLYNFAGAGLIMIGLSVIMQYGNNLEIFKHIPLTNEIIFAVALLTIGFLAKAAQLPIRIDYQMHPKPAPTPISGYISSVMLKTGPFMLAKMFFFLAALGSFAFLSQIETISYISAWIGAITIVVAASFAILTNSMKRLLIFHTVSQLGYIVVGFSVVTGLGFMGGMFHFINHMFFKDLLFLTAGAIFYVTNEDRLDRLGGIAKKMPITFATFVIGVLAISGVPMFNGFVSKWLIYHAAFEKGYVAIAILALFGSVLTLVSFIKFMHSAYFGEVADKYKNIKEVSLYMTIPMMILAFLCIILGVFPSLMLTPINTIVYNLTGEMIDLSTFTVHINGVMFNTVIITVALISLLVLFYYLSVKAKVRESHVYLCGVRDLTTTEKHYKSTDYYEDIKKLVKNTVKITKKLTGLKGSYNER